MGTKIDMFGNEYFQLNNGARMLYYNNIYMLFSPQGIKIPEEYDCKDKAIKRLKEIYKPK